MLVTQKKKNTSFSSTPSAPNALQLSSTSLLCVLSNQALYLYDLGFDHKPVCTLSVTTLAATITPLKDREGDSIGFRVATWSAVGRFSSGRHLLGAVTCGSGLGVVVVYHCVSEFSNRWVEGVRLGSSSSFQPLSIAWSPTTTTTPPPNDHQYTSETSLVVGGKGGQLVVWQLSNLVSSSSSSSSVINANCVWKGGLGDGCLGLPLLLQERTKLDCWFTSVAWVAGDGDEEEEGKEMIVTGADDGSVLLWEVTNSCPSTQLTTNRHFGLIFLYEICPPDGHLVVLLLPSSPSISSSFSSSALLIAKQEAGPLLVLVSTRITNEDYSVDKRGSESGGTGTVSCACWACPALPDIGDRNRERAKSEEVQLLVGYFDGGEVLQLTTTGAEPNSLDSTSSSPTLSPTFPSFRVVDGVLKIEDSSLLWGLALSPNGTSLFTLEEGSSTIGKRRSRTGEERTSGVSLVQRWFVPPLPLRGDRPTTLTPPPTVEGNAAGLSNLLVDALVRGKRKRRRGAPTRSSSISPVWYWDIIEYFRATLHHNHPHHQLSHSLETSFYSLTESQRLNLESSHPLVVGLKLAIVLHSQLGLPQTTGREKLQRFINSIQQRNLLALLHSYLHYWGTRRKFLAFDDKYRDWLESSLWVSCDWLSAITTTPEGKAIVDPVVIAVRNHLLSISADAQKQQQKKRHNSCLQCSADLLVRASHSCFPIVQCDTCQRSQARCCFTMRPVAEFDDKDEDDHLGMKSRTCSWCHCKSLVLGLDSSPWLRMWRRWWSSDRGEEEKPVLGVRKDVFSFDVFSLCPICDSLL